MNEEKVKEESEKPLEVTIKKEIEKPEPDYDYDSDQLSDDEIVGLEKEIDAITKKRVNQDSI